MIKIHCLLLILVMFNNCYPCSCIGKKTVKQEFKISDAVFEGKILSKNEFVVRDDNLPKGYQMFRVEYKIILKTAYKGVFKKDTITLITGVGGGDCGVEFVLDKCYIIYAQFLDRYFPSGQNVSRYLYTDICSRTIMCNKNERQKLKRLMKDKKLLSTTPT